MVPSLTARLDSKRSRRWRSVLAVLISIAVVLSYFHDWSFEGNDGTLTVAAVQLSALSGDTSGKSAPDWGAPHGDHCLAHVSTVAPQDSAVPIEYVTRAYRVAATPLPEGADPASPFKPPRA